MTEPVREPSTPDAGVDVPAWGERSSGPRPPRTARARKVPVTPRTAQPPAAPPSTTTATADVAAAELPVVELPVAGPPIANVSGVDLPDGDESDGIDPDTGLPIRTGPDPVGVAAVVVGCLGILVLGLVLAVVAGVLAAEAGRRAKAERRSVELAYWGLALAGIDGVWWIVMHFVFDLKVWVG